MPRALIPNSTQIPDIILDHWMAELSDAEFRVLLYVARRTFGFGKDSDNISLTQLTSGIRRRDGSPLDRGTGLSRSGVKKACKGLIERGVLLRFRNTAPDGRESEESTYRLNLFASLPETEEGVGHQKTYPGHVVAYPEVGHHVAQVGHKKAEGRPRSSPGVGHQVTPQETAQETEQETAAEKLADAELIELLVQKGVGRSVAVRLATEKPDQCRQQLAWLPFATVKTTTGTWLANAIKHEYGPPKGVQKHRVQPRAGQGISFHDAKATGKPRGEQSEEFVNRLRSHYARLEKVQPDAIAAFNTFFKCERGKGLKFADTLSAKGREQFHHEAESEEFRMSLFDRWLGGEGRKYRAAVQPVERHDTRRTRPDEFSEPIEQVAG